MKKFIKVMMIIAGVFLALGIGFSAAGAAMGACMEDMGMTDELQNGLQIMKNITVGNRHGSSQEEQQSAATGETIKENTRFCTVDAADYIEISLRSDELVLQEYSGDKIKIEIENDKEENVKVTSSASKLEIRSSRRKSSRRVTVYYPAGKHFSEVKISVDAGSAYVNSALYSEKMEVEIGAGEFFSEESVELSELDVEVGADYNYYLECGIGEISIHGDRCGGLGSEKRITNPGAAGEMDLECGIGEIAVEFHES